MNKKIISLFLAVVMLAAIVAGCTTVATPAAPAGGAAAAPAGEVVTLEFTQWWEPELPEGAFRALMDEFEAQNPGIKVELISGPYATTREQVVAGAAAGTMSDVVGLDGAWVNDFVKQGALASLTDLMQQAGYDDSELAAQIQLDGATYMIPVVNFVYPVFANLDLLAKAGIENPPGTRSEFAEVAKKCQFAPVTAPPICGQAAPRKSMWRSRKRTLICGQAAPCLCGHGTPLSNSVSPST